jgi:ABC-2 type transport system permease protein
MNNRWMSELFRSEIRKIFAYRADFWVQYLFNIAAHIGVAYFLWQAIFTANGVTEMRGYSFTALMFYYLLVPVIGRVIYGSELGAIGREIYDGSLTRYIIYPVNFFQYKLIQYLANSLVYTVQMVVVILLFTLIFGVPEDVTFSSATLLILPTLFLSALLNFAIIITLELFAFWADNVWTLLVMVRFSVGLLGGGMIPLTFFPEWGELLLRKLPFVYLTAFPIDLLMGKVNLSQWLEGSVITVLWTILFIFTANLVWNRGKLKYTGVGI